MDSLGLDLEELGGEAKRLFLCQGSGAWSGFTHPPLGQMDLPKLSSRGQASPALGAGTEWTMLERVRGAGAQVLKREQKGQETSPGCPTLLRSAVRSDSQVLHGSLSQPVLSRPSDHPVRQDPGLLMGRESRL